MKLRDWEGKVEVYVGNTRWMSKRKYKAENRDWVKGTYCTVEKSSIQFIITQTRQLKWYGHLLRMEDSSWPKKIYQWTPHGRRRIGRLQQSWKNQVTDHEKQKHGR